jgi:hypothetical protein
MGDRSLSGGALPGAEAVRSAVIGARKREIVKIGAVEWASITSLSFYG